MPAFIAQVLRLGMPAVPMTATEAERDPMTQAQDEAQLTPRTETWAAALVGGQC